MERSQRFSNHIEVIEIKSKVLNNVFYFLKNGAFKMKKGDKGRGIWGAIVILMVVMAVLGGVVSAENVSDDLTKCVADAEI
jgi:hypothetical protein